MKVLIFDALNLFIRNFCVVPSMDEDGEATGGIVGSLRSMKALTRDVKPDLVLLVWDGEGGSLRRRGIFKEYKAGRKVRLNRGLEQTAEPETAVKNMSTQIKRLKRLSSLLGIVQIEIPMIEADDSIAYICNWLMPDDEKVIVTSDRDMLQLVNSRTVVYSPSKKLYWTSDKMLEEIGVLPENYVYVKALMGDSSDNIKGIGGVGEKTALKLFPFLAERPTTFEEILSFAESKVDEGSKYKSVVEQKDRLSENVKLMQLSHPIFSAQQASVIRTQVTQQKPRFSFAEFKVEMTLQKIRMQDTDFDSVFGAYRRRFIAS